jgi:DNA end-binding protein Ku
MPPRAIWSGTITFGLIAIPVKLYTAVGRESDDKVEFHLLHEKDNARIRNERRCAKGHKVDWDEVVRGHEYSKGKWVTFTDEELDALDVESLHTIDVVTFVPSEQIDPIYVDHTYYVSPESSGTKAYKLFIDALEHEGLVGVAKVAIREREHLAMIRTVDGEISLHTLHWPNEIRKRQKTSGRPTLRDNEKRMARQLVQQLAGEFDPTEFTDEYHEAIKKAIKRKVKGEEIVEPAEREQPAEVGDLMEALKRSVEETNKRRRKRAS